MDTMCHARIVEYGCTLCQAYHRQGETVYAEHLLFQSRHGISERPDPDRFVPAEHPEAYHAPLPNG